MRPIYTAPTVEAAQLALDRFAQSWEARYPMSIAAWRNHWNDLTTFFRYPVELRRMIYTTNAIESLHSPRTFYSWRHCGSCRYPAFRIMLGIAEMLFQFQFQEKASSVSFTSV
jgi:hypothetical protein